MKVFQLTIIIFFIAFLLSCNEVSVEEHNIQNGVAINGYDPVAYHNNNVSVGNSAYSYNYKGAKYLFASEANLNSFSNEPEKFAPKYGGYCAFGVSVGKKFEVDPNAFAVVDNELYLLLNQATLKTWESARDKNISIANKLWPSLKDIPAAELNKEE